MDLPKKILILNCMKKVCPEWALILQAKAVERAFDADISKAKSEKERDNLTSRCQYDVEPFYGALDALRSRRLFRKAQKLHIATEDLKWQEDEWGHSSISNASQSKLARSIKEDERATWEFRFKIIASLIGLIGALIGLIAILKK
jgi:hypothetical protein